MRSPTQRTLVRADIEKVLGQPVTEAGELTGGGFAAVWWARLGDGREVVVKVGPPASARLLTYERDLLTREAEYFRLVQSRAPGVPVPHVVAGDRDWIVTTRLPGLALTERDSPRAREQLGAAVAEVHRITGPHFGYVGDRPSAEDWPAAFLGMVAALRSDATDWNVPVPPLEGVVERHHATLAAVTRPALLHFDLWDGNVLAGPDGELTGLVDGERYLYGDPLLDLVSPALFRRIEDEPDHPFLRGYRPEALDRAALTRLSLYRLHLYLLMLVEGPSRGIPATDGRQEHVTRLLTEEISRLSG